MKNLINNSIPLLLLLVILFNSCQDPDDTFNSLIDPNYVTETFFSPPNWIIGKWESQPKDDSESKIVFEFTSDNIIDPFYGNRNDDINRYRSYRYDATVEETRSNMVYSAVINYIINPFTYQFEKIDEKTIVVIRGYDNGQIELYKME